MQKVDLCIKGNGGKSYNFARIKRKGKMEKGKKGEYEEYKESVERQRGTNAQEELGGGEYEGVIGEVWGEIKGKMGEGEVYESGGIGMRIEGGGGSKWIGMKVKGRKAEWGSKVSVRVGKKMGKEVRRWYRKGSAW